MARGVDEFPNPQSLMLGPRVQPQAWMHYNSRIGECWGVTTITTAAFADVGGYSRHCGGGAWGYRVIGDPMSVAWHAHGVSQCRECDQRRMIEEKQRETIS